VARISLFPSFLPPLLFRILMIPLIILSRSWLRVILLTVHAIYLTDWGPTESTNEQIIDLH
jgi:hypothetical protein